MIRDGGLLTVMDDDVIVRSDHINNDGAPIEECSERVPMRLLRLLLAALVCRQAAPAESAAAATDCGLPWTAYDRTKSCFTVIEQRLRWADAERACAKLGGRLAAIVDEFENDFAFGEKSPSGSQNLQTWLAEPT
jgi:hypothetical protein